MVEIKPRGLRNQKRIMKNTIQGININTEQKKNKKIGHS